jgi:pimeloyl-ACP methyl ester carboxylesterase
MVTGVEVTTTDIALADGRSVRVHDTGPQGDGLAVLWHHGSPQTGALLDPLVAAASARGLRLLSYGRPSYGGSTPQPGRTVASAAGDVEQILDALGIGSIATMGASGGGPHALACAALLPDRVVAAVSLAGIAPLTDDYDWYAGMVADGGLRAATAGRASRAAFAETDEFDENSFIAADWALLQGEWASLGTDAGRAGADGDDGLIDDDVAFTHPWGFDPARIEVPVLVVQGRLDRVIPASHGEWLARTCPNAELWVRARASHVSILAASPLAMDWITAQLS